jgi:hypothetical protein
VKFRPFAPDAILRSPIAKTRIQRIDVERLERPMEATRWTWTKVIVLLVGMILAGGSAGRSLNARSRVETIGAITGAAAGGIMGSVVGHTAAGAVIGGGLGAGAGTLIHDELRRQENDKGRAEARLSQQSGATRQAESPID